MDGGRRNGSWRAPTEAQLWVLRPSPRRQDQTLVVQASIKALADVQHDRSISVGEH